LIPASGIVPEMTVERLARRWTGDISGAASVGARISLTIQESRYVLKSRRGLRDI